MTEPNNINFRDFFERWRASMSEDGGRIPDIFGLSTTWHTDMDYTSTKKDHFNDCEDLFEV